MDPDEPVVDDSSYDAETGAYDYDYDGWYHDVVYGVLVQDVDGLVDDAVIDYSITDEEGNVVEFVDTDENGIPEVKNVGEYTVVITVVVEDVEIELTAVATVSPAAVTITVDNATKVEGEVDPTIDATIEGLQGEDTMAYEVSRIAGEVEGAYVATATYTEDSNYVVTVVDGSLTITAAPVVEEDPTEDEPTDDPTEDDATDDDTEDDTTVVVITPAVDTEDGFTDPATDETVEIEDEEVPLAEEPVVEEDTTEILDQEVPLASAIDGGAWALLNLILAIGTAAASAILLIGYFMNRKSKEEEEEEEEEEEAATEEEKEENAKKNKGIFRTLSLIPALGSIVLFILTENMLNPMVIADKWTLTMIVIALVQVAVAIASRKKDEEKSEEEEEMYA